MTVIRDASFIKKKTIADKLIELREKNNISQSELAEKLFTSRSTVAKWETSRAIPSDTTLATIIKLYNVDKDYFQMKKYTPSDEVKSKELVIEDFSFKTFFKLSYKLLLLCTAALILVITITSIVMHKHLDTCTLGYTSKDCDIRWEQVTYDSNYIELNSDFVIPNKIKVKNHTSIFPYRVNPSSVTINGPVKINSLKISKTVNTIDIYTAVNNVSVNSKNKNIDSRENCNCIIDSKENCLLYASSGDFFIPYSVTSMTTISLLYVTKEEVYLNNIDDLEFKYPPTNEDFNLFYWNMIQLSGSIQYIDFGNFSKNFCLSRKLDEAVISPKLAANLDHDIFNDIETIYFKGTMAEYSATKTCNISCNCRKNVYYQDSMLSSDRTWHYDENHRAVIG